MPQFGVTLPNGREILIEGDRPPERSELDAIWQKVRTPEDAEAERKRISAEVHARQPQQASDTWARAQMAGAAGMAQAAADPILGAFRLLNEVPAVRGTPTGTTMSWLARLAQPVSEAGQAAEEAAAAMPGNDAASATANAIGSAVGSAPYAMVPVLGGGLSVGAAGLQSFESTRRDAVKTLAEAGMPLEEAEQTGMKIALGAGVITAGVTAAFNRFGGRFGLGKGVERGLSSKIQQVTIDELRKSAFGQTLKKVAQEALGEGAEEAVDQALQEGFIRWQYDKSQTLADSVKQVAKAFALGTVAGGVIGGPGAAAEVVGNRLEGVRQVSRGDFRPREAGAGAPPSLQGVPGDTAALATPVDIPAAPSEAQPPPAGVPERAPGTYVYGVTAEGKPFEAQQPAGADPAVAKDYIERAMPGAKVSRVEIVSTPDGGTNPPSLPAQPQPQESNGQEAQGRSEDQNGLLNPPTESGPPVVDSGNSEAVVSGATEATGAPQVEVPASSPSSPPRKRRVIARQPVGDILDDIEQAGGLISKSQAKKLGLLEKLGPEYDDAGSLSHPSHGFVYSNGSGGKGKLTPDKALQAIQSANPGKYGDMTIPEMWAAIQAASRGRVSEAGRRQAEIKQAKTDADFADSTSSDKGRQEVLPGDLGVGETLTVDGEKVKVTGYDPGTGDVILDDGKRFGRQRVAPDQVLYVDRVDPAGKYSLGGGDLFGAPESVEEQKARLAREKAQAKARADREEMLRRQAAPITGRAVDTTGDMFDTLAGDAPLFSQPQKPGKPTPAKPQQGSLFSVGNAPTKGFSPLGVDSAKSTIERILGKVPSRIRLEPGQPTSNGARIEGYITPDGEVVIHPDNLQSEADLLRVLRHESLHDVFDDPQVRGAWNRLMATMDRPAREKRVRGEGYTSNVLEESALDEAENRVDTKQPLFRRWVASIVNALYRRGHADLAGAIFGLDRLADSDARALVGYATRLERFEKTHSTRSGSRNSIGQVNPDAQPAREGKPESNAQSGQDSGPIVTGNGNSTLWRAGDPDENGIKPFASFSESRTTAEAYLDNPGFGGKKLRGVRVDLNHSDVINANTTNRKGMAKFAEALGFNPEIGDEWFDSGWRYPWEESSKVKTALENSGFKWLRYVDDFPSGALTVIRIAPFDPHPASRAGEKFSLASIQEDEPARAALGRGASPLESELASEGARLQAEMGARGSTFSAWRDAMLERHGDAILPLLGRVWEHTKSIRYSLEHGLPPETVADIADITAEANATPSAIDPKQPTPVYNSEMVAKWWHKLVRPSDVISRFGGEDMIRKRNLIDLRTAWQAAEVRKQSEALSRQLENSFYGDNAGPILRFVRQFAPREKLRRFMRHALPIAARINVTGGEPGAFTFSDFQQRAGFLPESQAAKRGVETGQAISWADPITGKFEVLKVGDKITLEDGRKGYQLLRDMPSDRQQRLYEWAQQEFPEFAWFLNTWVDPRLADTRIKVNGVDLPVFNRLALAGRYAEGDPGFTPRPAYTPDVGVGVGLLRKFLTQRKVTFREGITSPGRFYETGEARERGRTLDLLSGFNVRAMQVMQEQVRQEWARYVLGKAEPVPAEGLPVGWTRIETAMQDIADADRRTRQAHPLDFPQLDPDKPAPDLSASLERLFGDLARMPREGPPMMIPEPFVEALKGDMATVQTFGLLGELGRLWAKNWKAFLLLMPTTFAANRTDNYLRMLIESHRQLWLAAIKGGDREALTAARKLAWASIVNVIPGVRPLLGLHDEALFRQVREQVLPPEVFGDSTRMRDLWLEKGDVTQEIESALSQGKRGMAIGKAAANLGPLILEKSGYGNIDVRAKQQFAFTVLLAKAEHAAWSRGLRGEVKKGFIREFMLNPPEIAVADAVDQAGKNLLRYGDSPGWLGKLARIPALNTFVAFPMFRYHFVGREIDRATKALRLFHKGFVRGKKLTRDQWAEALADTISYVMLPVMGYAASKVAGALTDSLLAGAAGGDDDDPRQFVGASSRFDTDPDGNTVRKPLPRELVTANRLNISAMLRQVGIETGSEEDYWWAMKDYPIVRSTALFYLAAEDARKHGARAGIVTLGNGLKDLMTPLMGTGQAVKVPAKIAAELEGAEAGKPAFTSVDPYATNVPLDAYLTLQAMNLIPGQRQASEIIKWLDPVPRRITRSKSLDYDPGVKEALRSEGWTGLADRAARGLMTGDPSSPLPPQGTIDRRHGYVETPRSHSLAERIAALMGQNIKGIPRDEYQRAVEE